MMPRRKRGSDDKGSISPLQGESRGSIPRTSTKNILDIPFGYPRPAPKPSQTKKPRGRERKTQETDED